jgi:phosphoribosyl 1,2-cyclic phosphate phosphodiesterase
VGPEARNLAAGADVVVLDGLRPEPHPSHMTVQEAVDTALALQAERSFITHMTYKIDHATVDATLPASISLAYDGLRLTI